MKHFVLSVSLGAAIGGSLVFAFLAADSRQSESRPLMIPASTMSLEEAEQHRSADYAELQSIPEVLALPTPFSRNAALHRLSSRATAGQLAQLVNDAERIDDAVTRRQFLETLFSRLAETDPALAIDVGYGLDARDREQWVSFVWTVWSTFDLDAAVDQAGRLDGRAERYQAAVAMFRAHGYIGTPEVQRIADSLGIQPDLTVKLEYVAYLSKQDPAAAVDYVSSLPMGMTRQRASLVLAQSIATTDAGQLARTIESLPNGDMKRMLEMQTRAFTIQADPEAAVLASLNSGRQDDGMFHVAAQSLAESDLARAMEIFDLATSPMQRQSLAMAIAQTFANTDPEGALAWARSAGLPQQQRDQIEAQVINSMARNHPDLAFSIAIDAAENGNKPQYLQTVLSSIAQTDPSKALSLLGSLPNMTLNAQTRAVVLQTIAYRSPEAALEWILADPSRADTQGLSLVGHALARKDVDLAIAALPRVDEESRKAWRITIVSTLAHSGRIDAALQFANQQRGSENYAEVQAALVQSIAISDSDRASSMLNELPPGRARDNVIATLANGRVGTSGESALDMASSIEDEHIRSQTVRNLLMQWSSRDPGAAEAWAGRLGSTAERDTAYHALAQTLWNDPTRAMQMTGRIQDENSRVGAQWSIIQQQARMNPGMLEQLLEQSSMSESQKEQLRERVQRRNDLELIRNSNAYQ